MCTRDHSSLMERDLRGGQSHIVQPEHYFHLHSIPIETLNGYHNSPWNYNKGKGHVSEFTCNWILNVSFLFKYVKLLCTNFILSAQNSQCAHHPWGKGTKGTTTKQHDKGLNMKHLQNMYKTMYVPTIHAPVISLNQNRWWTQLGIEILLSNWIIAACTQETQLFFLCGGQDSRCSSQWWNCKRVHKQGEIRWNYSEQGYITF